MKKGQKSKFENFQSSQLTMQQESLVRGGCSGKSTGQKVVDVRGQG